MKDDYTVELVYELRLYLNEDDALFLGTFAKDPINCKKAITSFILKHLNLMGLRASIYTTSEYIQLRFSLVVSTPKMLEINSKILEQIAEQVFMSTVMYQDKIEETLEVMGFVTIVAVVFDENKSFIRSVQLVADADEYFRNNLED